MDGRRDRDFVVDVFQTGSGTSTNMNANEVIANRAIELLGGVIGSKVPVHPNDHVNAGQSSNDVVPTALHVAALLGLRNDLLPALDVLHASLARKAGEFAATVKTGRTHLMDASPVTLGQELGGYAAQIANGSRRVRRAMPGLDELALGGTAVGTGLNAPPGYAAAIVARQRAASGVLERRGPLHQAERLDEAAREAASRDGEVLDRAPRLCAVVRVRRDLDRPQACLLYTSPSPRD